MAYQLAIQPQLTTGAFDFARTFPPFENRRGWAHARVLPSAVATLHSIVPCFIVESLQASLDFYQSKLGFEIAYKGGGNGDGEDFWAFVRRDGVMVSFKAIAPEIHPQPNHSRHEWARWDAYIHASDPDSLYEEYVSRSVPMHQPLSDTEDGPSTSLRAGSARLRSDRQQRLRDLLRKAAGTVGPSFENREGWVSPPRNSAPSTGPAM